MNRSQVWEPQGIVKLTNIQDEFHIIVAARDVTQATHRQSIHIARKCPDYQSDKNLDGLIDGHEVQIKVGKAIIPLDSDLESQTSGHGNYPYGNYRYDQRVSYSKMLGDLQDIVRPHPEFRKLKGRELPFKQLIVIIYGVPSDYIVPETVAATDGLTRQASLPVACAKLSNRGSIPDEPDVSPPARPPQVSQPGPDPIPTIPSTPPPRPGWRERMGSAWRRVWCRVRRCETNSVW